MSTAPTRRFQEKPRVELGKLFDKLPPHALEAEAALLGSMILDGQVIGEVVQIIKGEDDFYKASHRAIYSALVTLYDQNQVIDMVHLNQRLRDKGELDGIGGVDYLLSLAESVPSATSAGYYAKLVREKAVLRQLIDAAGTILHEAYTSGEPVGDLLDNAEQAIFRLAENKSDTEATDINTLIQEAYTRLETQDGRIVTGIESGFFELDEMLSGLQNGELIIIAARPSMGKAQPLDARVLTPRGFVAMGDLNIGDELASLDGAPSRVEGIYPQGERQAYRVTFADGRSTECCAEHLWRVSHRGWPEPRVLSTARLMDLLSRRRYQNRLWIDTFTGVFGDADESAMPVDPWLLGALLGDGSLSGTSLRFSSASEEILAEVRRVVGDEMEVTHAGDYDYRIVRAGGARRRGVQGVLPNPIVQELRRLGLWERDASMKFIPPAYLNASRCVRLKLLAGLIDTDGWVEKFGAIRLATTSSRLAADVVALTRSLGGTACFFPKPTSYSYRGEKLAGQTCYVCNLQMPDPTELPLVSRKAGRLAARRRQRRLNIVSITPTRVTQTQCIAVSHPSRLYVTDEFVVTHNTAFALNIAEHIGVVNKQPVAFFSLEMSKQQLAQRMLCSRSGVDSQRLRRNMLGADDWPDLQRACAELTDAPVFIDDTPGLSLLALRAKARRLAARHHIKAVFIDYLQLMSGPKSDSREQEVSAISRGVKALARELSVPVVCLSQLNRQSESREGHRPRMSDLRESGSIEQDADVVLMLHREDYYHRGDKEYVDNNVSEVIIAKQRNGPTGTVELLFNSHTTRFQNLKGGGNAAG